MKGLIYPFPHYRSFELAKRNGGTRTIETPALKLKEMQRQIAEALTASFGRKSNSAHAFLPGRSVVSNARPHVARACVIRVDLKDFFHQINFGRVKGLFLSSIFALPNDVASVLAHICCLNGRLPQGAPTSPILSNYICLALDAKLRKLATRYKARYTRYCDDLTFSFASIPLDHVPAAMFLVAAGPNGSFSVEPGLLLGAEILKQGFVVNADKTRGTNRNKRQMVTGIVVNDELRVPSKFTSQIRRALHLWGKFGVADAALRAIPVLRRKTYASGQEPSLPELIRGKLTWVANINGRANGLYQSLALKFNSLAIRDGLPELQIPIDPKVKNFPEAQAATWFVRGENQTGEYDVFDGTAIKLAGHEWVTCAHCVGNLKTKTVHSSIYLFSQNKSLGPIGARAVHVDWDRDLAILRPSPLVRVPRHLAYFEVANYVPIAAAVVGVMGYPSSHEHQPPVFFRARVVRTRPLKGVLRIEIDKSIQQGNSGGPVFDDKYRLVGVVVEGATIDEGMNSCVGASEIATARSA